MDVHVPKWLQSQTWLYSGKQEIVEQSLKDCQAYDPFSTVYSDHKIFVTKLRLSLLANGKTTTNVPVSTGIVLAPAIP